MIVCKNLSGKQILKVMRITSSKTIEKLFTIDTIDLHAIIVLMISSISFISCTNSTKNKSVKIPFNNNCIAEIYGIPDFDSLKNNLPVESNYGEYYFYDSISNNKLFVNMYKDSLKYDMVRSKDFLDYCKTYLNFYNKGYQIKLVPLGIVVENMNIIIYYLEFNNNKPVNEKSFLMEYYSPKYYMFLKLETIDKEYDLQKIVNWGTELKENIALSINCK